MSLNKSVCLWFSDFWRPSTVETIPQLGLYHLLAKRWNMILSPERPDFLIYSCFGFEHLKYDCIRIFYTGENVRPRFDRCDYAFSFDYPVTERNYRLPLYRLNAAYGQLFALRTPDKIMAEDRQFCSFLSSNPRAAERVRFFDLLSKYKKVDSGGRDRNNIGYPVTDKMAWMQRYKFSIAFENSEHPGYSTEKLLHALAANTIPIYWGNPLVANDFNPRSFINCHAYKSFEDVVEVVKRIDQDDALYRECLSQPFLPNNAENDFCREETILARFERIFTEGREFVPRSRKKAQKLIFLALKSLQPARLIYRFLAKKIKGISH